MRLKRNWDGGGVLILLKSQSMTNPYMHLENLPAYGLMVYDHDLPVAAGFLKIVEGGKSAILDSLITNGDLPAEQRDLALDLLVENILKDAKALGIKQILAFSSDRNTLVRAQRFGFAQLEHHVITLPLF